MRPCPQCGFDCDAAHKFCPSCGFPISQVAKDSDDPLIGRRLPGGYVILELVGIGGMGRVYRAEQTNLGRTVAIKIIHPHLVGEENAAARFITEARAASRLNHPNSVSVIDFGKTTDDQLYLVMEFLRGRDLARVAYEEGPLPFRRIIDILRQVLAALGEAHHNEIIHRDLKPENIILEPMRAGGDFVKVVDFGLAKMRIESAPSITSPGIVCGTPEYMSPEQGRGDPLDPRSDLYAVGVILYQLLVGRLPFEADSPTQVVLMHISKPPPDPRSVAPGRLIPESIISTLMKSLSKEPDDRYPDADTFSAALLRTAQDADNALSARSATLSSVRCQKCGAMNALSQKFCGECGASMAPYEAAERVVIPKPTRTPRGSQSGITAIVPLSERGTRPRFPLPLVGRDDDLAWLEERRASARTGLSAARIVGDSGMGKTRLMRDFLMIAAASGDTVVVGNPDPAWAEVGFYTLRRVITALAGLPADGGASKAWTAAGAEARQGLADVFGTEESAASVARLSPDVRRYAAAEALRWALVRSNERTSGRRVLLAIDDLQCVDGASRNAIADCVAEPPLIPVLLIATHTPEFRPDWSSTAGPPRIIGGLPGAVVTRLLASTSTPSAPSLSGGRGIQPLYVDQLVRFLHEHGGGAPARLADLIALRVERLPADARRLLQAIAVVGDDATPAMLAPLLAGDAEGAQAARDVLLRAGMIEPAADTDGSKTVHPLLRDVVLASIPAEIRKRLHAIAAEASQDRGAPLEVRAMHEIYAQNAFEALILLERVSALCAARGDLAGNILALRRGLELARRELFRGELDDPMRAVLIFSRKLGEALALAGAYMDAEGILREALDMAGPSGQDRARVLGALAHVAHGRERRQEAQAYLREALELATRSNSRELARRSEARDRVVKLRARAAAVAIACGSCASERPPAELVRTAAIAPRPPAGFADVTASCAAIASCARGGEPARLRDPSACADAWLAGALGDAAPCVARARASAKSAGICAAIRACERGDDPAAVAFCDRRAGVFSACDGSRFVSCGDDDGPATAVDCAAFGATCVETRIANGVVARGCASPKLCPPGAPESRCDGDAAVVVCHDAMVERAECAKDARCVARPDEGGAMVAACATATFGACAEPGTASCDGHDLVACAPDGDFAALRRTDCTRLGLECRERGRRAACVVLGAEPCAADEPRCDGDFLAYCAAGVEAKVACSHLGLGPCEAAARGRGSACGPPLAASDASSLGAPAQPN